MSPRRLRNSSCSAGKPSAHLSVDGGFIPTGMLAGNLRPKRAAHESPCRRDHLNGRCAALPPQHLSDPVVDYFDTEWIARVSHRHLHCSNRSAASEFLRGEWHVSTGTPEEAWHGKVTGYMLPPAGGNMPPRRRRMPGTRDVCTYLATRSSSCSAARVHWPLSSLAATVGRLLARSVRGVRGRSWSIG